MPKPDVKKDGTPIHRCGATMTRRLILTAALLAAVVLLAARCAEIALVSAP